MTRARKPRSSFQTVICLQQNRRIRPVWLGAGQPMLNSSSNGPKRVRTLFLSDIHLGTRGCQAERLLDFLRHYETATLYLVGDIVDGWQLKSAWYWPQSHNDVVQKLLRQVRKNVRLRHIPGHHGEILPGYFRARF